MSTPPEPTPTPDTPPGDGAKPATGEPTLEERLKAAEADREKWQNLSRKNEERAKANAEKAKRFDELEAASKSDLEKANEARGAAEQRIAALTQRAVQAEVRALAAATFADPTDADLLGDLSGYIGEDGEIDTKAIAADLAALLKAKPHLGKATAPSFDGGARTPAGAPASMNDLIRQQAGVTR